jgi:hypothetical protein
VAFHETYRADYWPSTVLGLQPRDFWMHLEGPLRLLAGDTGWVVATPECPHPLIRAAARRF